MKILTVVGARPQFIKAGILSQELQKYKSIQEIIIHTGQHYNSNMSDIFFKEMGIKRADYHLGVGGKRHGEMIGDMIKGIEKIIIKEKPNIILLYGDTNSTLAGALVASKLHIPIAHIEAGLRSFNIKMAEEINRILTDRVSRWLFCPTKRAMENLEREGFKNFNCKIIESGDIMYDGTLLYKRYAKKPKSIEIKENFILCTIHRAENTDSAERLIDIFQALQEIAEEIQIILPLHPRTEKIIKYLNIDIKNITLIEPIGYLQMLWLLQKSRLVITDSGGLQKEAFFLKKRCITLRDETEWIELIDEGVNILTGADRENILNGYREILNRELKFNRNLYGRGDASKIIVEELLNG